MMKRYLPVIFTIFAIIFTHGHAVAADTLPSTPELIGCTEIGCDDTSSYREEANCAKTICKRYIDGYNRIAEFTSCEKCNEGYKQTPKTTASCGGLSISGLYACKLDTINCTNKCNSCGPTTNVINTYYTKTINRSCEQVGTNCECVEKAPTYSCSPNALQTENSVDCNVFGCSGCSKCPTDATCNGSKTFTCKSGYYKPQNSNSCTKCPDNYRTCDSTGFTCKERYYVLGNSCASCPSNATCNDGTNFKCNDGYYKPQDSNSCKACPANSKCTSQKDFTCNDEYCKSGDRCEKLPDNAKCVDGVTKCNANYYKSGSACKSCGSIKIGDQTITATSDVGATSKYDCRVPDDEFNKEKNIEINGHTATIKIKSCY